MKVARLLMVLLAVGCGAVESLEDASPDPLVELEPSYPPRGDEAVALAVASYETELGMELPPVTVHWVAERIPYLDTTVTGLHRGCGDIWVTWWDEVGDDFHTIALAHEIGHCARGAFAGDTDGAHTDAAWWARNDSLVELVESRLRAAGL